MSLWFKRFVAAVFLGGQTIVHILKGKFNYPNILEQMALVGPESLLIALLISTTVGMVFTIQVAREFINIGAGQVVGGRAIVDTHPRTRTGTNCGSISGKGWLSVRRRNWHDESERTNRCAVYSQDRSGRLFSNSPGDRLLRDVTITHSFIDRRWNVRGAINCN
jgi:hypothetical protein